MALIDTSKIEGYSAMTAEEKLKALESFEIEDNSAELERYKNMYLKASSEAAENKRKYKELLTEDERKKLEREQSFNDMKTELESLKKQNSINECKAELLGLGYSDEQASNASKALIENDLTSFYKIQSDFNKSQKSAIEKELMGRTPTTPSGTSNTESDYKKLIETARVNGDQAAVAYYTRAEQEAKISK